MSKKRKPDPTISLPIRISTSELVEAVLDLAHDELMSMIKEIDSRVASYEFTEELRDYLSAELAKEDAANQDPQRAAP